MYLNETHVFPGNNTVQGFFSYYDQIISQNEAEEIYCIKGGPGVGKSTFMKKLGEDLLKKGYTIEFLHCSSDNNSLDGILIKEKKILFVDGTSPHIVDPKHPGAVDVILNFGDFFNASMLKEHKNDIINLTKIIGEQFKMAYRYLSSMKSIYSNIEATYEEALDEDKLNNVAESLIKEIFGDKKGVKPNDRKLFLSAMTPDGIINYVDKSIYNKNIYIINGKVGDSSHKLINMIKYEAIKRKMSIKTFYSFLDPENKIDHLVIDDLDTAILTSNKFNDFKKEGKVIDISECYDDSKLNSDNLIFDHKIMDMLIEKVESTISFAKKKHDALEGFYNPAVDFESVFKLKDEMKNKILEED